MHSCISGDKLTSSLTQGKDIYELEVQHKLCHLNFHQLKVSCTSSKCCFAAGFAASEGVRDPVPQTGNKLSQRRAAHSTSSNMHTHELCFSVHVFLFNSSPHTC